MAEPKAVAVGTKDVKMEFTVPQPYDEGHTLTAVEAKQLNQTFAENICNNMRAKVQATIEGKEGALSDSALRDAFAEYANNYVFTEASIGSGRSTMTPLEKESRKVAQKVVLLLLDRDGKKRKDVSKEDFEAEVARLADTDDVQKIAAKNLKDAERLASAVLGSAG